MSSQYLPPFVTLRTAVAPEHTREPVPETPPPVEEVKEVEEVSASVEDNAGVPSDPEATDPEATDPEVTDPEVEVVYNSRMRKAELLAVAESLGLEVTEENTRDEILVALDTATS